MSSSPAFGFDSARQSFWISFPGFSQLIFRPEAELDGKKITSFSWKPAAGKKNELVFLASNREGSWKFRVNPLDVRGEFQLEASLECTLKQTAQRVLLAPLVFQKFSTDHVLIHGRKMGSCENFVLERGESESILSNFLIATTRKGATLQLSHPLAQKEISSFTGQIAGKHLEALSAHTLFETCSRKGLRSAPVTLSASMQGHDLMVNWAEAQVTSREPISSPQESGWNTWDYYRWTITEDEVYKNAELIAADPVLSKHVKRIIVDDGWQYCYGEWESNHFFPGGMQKLARNLTRMGFTPGLWFAPTIAEPHSRLAQLEPDTLATGASGFPCLGFSCMERKGFILDPTHPRVQAWWDELFRRYADYGYRYFKLDFMAWTVKARRFHDPSARPGELMRRIVEPIRKAVGPKSRILGCNFNFDGGPGLVDDVRVSADIHVQWSSVKENVSAIAARFWSHERFWINDPDFTICRGEETSNDPTLHQLKPCLPFVQPDDLNPTGFDYLSSLVDLTEREAEVLLSLVITSGGAMNLSDNLPRLNKVGLDLLRKSVQAEKGSAAIPIDLFRSKYPSQWVQKLASGLHRVLLINWTDRKMNLDLDLAALNVPTGNLRNFWTNESVKTKGGRLSVSLAPHACLLAESHS